MKPTDTFDLLHIEAQARQMRAEALRDTLRALRNWLAARLAALRSAKSPAQHG